VKGATWLAAALLLGGAVVAPAAGPFTIARLNRVNARLCGRVVDYTHNHGVDRRLFSPALGEKRDLYVYLPPGFDPQQRYPVVLWLHGMAQDEYSFLDKVVELFDRAIVKGEIGPVIIAAPDGSIDGKPSWNSAGSFFVNSNAGNFEDYIVHDVWNFLTAHYPIRPEREAHVLAGGSMGGFGAYNLGIKYRACFKVVIGIFPPLNLRWVDCCCRYRAPFDPCCWGWRQCLNPNEVLARLNCGLIPVRQKQLTDQLYGRGPHVIHQVSRENPIEMIDRYELCEGELSMYVGWGAKDEYNIDAQVRSFLYLARERGLTVTAEVDPQGKHNMATGVRLFPGVIRWLAPQLAPYCPPLGLPCGP
jgi:hypothetical protein